MGRKNTEHVFILLNMSSATAAAGDEDIADDRTARARIRDAAITCFAEHGIAGTTARKVATAAGVSPGLVIHHFGSMDGLRAECDRHVAASIRQYKQEAILAGPSIDIFTALREADAGSWAGYLVAVLGDDSPIVAQLVDDLVSDAEDYLRLGVETGVIREIEDLRGTAAVLLLWSLGALVLHRHVQRILGVDLTDPDLGADPDIAAYVGPAYEIMRNGIFTDAFAATLSMTPTGDAGDPPDRPISSPFRPTSEEAT